ncbi:MAG: hypothetical protein QOF33_4100 [Thermomicrobiales bacterium]|nr:hypothetical protein [Thermomicrobiales bacterium]
MADDDGLDIGVTIRERVPTATTPKVKQQTIGWLKETLSGAVSSVVLFLIGLLFFRTGFSSSSELSFDLLSPHSLFGTFKSLVLELSTRGEYVLLIAGGTLGAVAGAAGAIWWRQADRDAAVAAKSGIRDRIAAEFGCRRTVTFVTVAALTVLGAYAYQQYLWNVALPIPKDALGFAITQEVSAASFQDELADALYTQGQAQRVVVRELPVRFDGGDTAKARALGKRLGARAVVIYRAEERGDIKRFVAYVVFTDPKIGLAVGGRPTGTSGDPSQLANQARTVQVKEGVEVPALRTETLGQLVNAAAGIIAYNDDRIREAIEHLELALPGDPADPHVGIVNFYLGNAYGVDNQDVAAVAAIERAIAHYEARTATGEQLPPHDELIFVKTYLLRGQLAGDAGDWNGALTWYDKADAQRDVLLTRAPGLERPEDVHATYARLYTEIANVYRFREKSDDVALWQARAKEELDTLSAAAGDGRTFLQESGARFILGDCVGASRAAKSALSLDQDDADALSNLAVVQGFQDRNDQARQLWEQVLALRPDDIQARRQLAVNWMGEALNLPNGFYEPAYLAKAEEQYREILRLDPTNLDAHEALGDIAEWRAKSAVLDFTAVMTGDKVSIAKSQNLWRADPSRRKAMLDGFATAIKERRVLAAELRPHDPASQVTLAETYVDRQSQLYMALYELGQTRDAAGVAAIGKSLMADAAEIHTWTDKVLSAESTATRTQRLQAWAVKLESLEQEWSWVTSYDESADDTAKAAAVKRYGEAVEVAISFVDEEPATSPTDVDAMSAIYYEAVIYFLMVQDDAAQQDVVLAKYEELSNSYTAGLKKETNHLDTTCAEAQQQAAGDEAFVAGDYATAAARYEAALETNPDAVHTLLNLGVTRYKEGDLEGGIVVTVRLTELAPAFPLAWWNLSYYRALSGETAGSEAAWDQFATLLQGMPVHERMGMIRRGLDDLSEELQEAQGHQATIGTFAERLRAEMEALPGDAIGTFQYPRLYETVGEVLLYAGILQESEAALEKALELDAHLPVARAALALAVIAQGRDAAPEIDDAIAESRDELWRDASLVGRADVLTLMQETVDRYLTLNPDRSAETRPLSQAIAAELARAATS